MDPRERATADALADPAGFKSYRKITPTVARRMTVPFYCETVNGPVDGKAGDYLCLDAKGVPYPCDASVFLETHAGPIEREGEGG
jgi:hypothetical protein